MRRRKRASPAAWALLPGIAPEPNPVRSLPRGAPSFDGPDERVPSLAVMWMVWALDEDMIDWLKSQNVDFPDTASRFPTIGEIRRTLDHPGLQVRISDGRL